ncbi:MFS transporter [Gluconacetobacter entanii]|uniref:MFS transporter n=1 Tax=Gluconacetobacter entanii TaxID=108528 RepID=A0ABT3K6C3_9PROT|nr:MFS transporter [Gluconacetobacter entanii]MCW4590934.1 MFS transporter [Gluconacetobacter entanii]MCW4594427.1 MFS transporter [Gluconacetobacter entanii]
MPTTQPPSSCAIPPSRRRIVAMIVASMLFMEQMDGTVLTTALPTMARTFGVDVAQTAVALTSYMLSLAIFIPASGPMADRFGGRRVLQCAIAVFMAGSLLCSVAPGLWPLAAARMLQGMGGAMMVPVGRLVILQNVPKSALIGVMFWMMLPATLGPMIGPVVGGVLTTYLSWRWIFYINMPVGLAAIVLTRIFIPQIRAPEIVPFDVRGIMLSGVGLAALMLGVELSSHGQISLMAMLGLCAVGIAGLAAYARHARHTAHPVLDLSLWQVTTFRVSVCAGLFSRLATGAVGFLLPSFLQLEFGLSAAYSGALTFVAPVGALLVRVLAVRVYRRWGFRNILALNAGVLPAACFFLAMVGADWPLWILVVMMLLLGMSQALQFTGYNTIAYADMPTGRMSAATSFYSTAQQMSLSLGICVSAGVLSLSRMAFSAPTTGEATAGTFSAAFVTMGVLAVPASMLLARLSPRAGAEISGHVREGSAAPPNYNKN